VAKDKFSQIPSIPVQPHCPRPGDHSGQHPITQFANSVACFLHLVSHIDNHFGMFLFPIPKWALNSAAGIIYITIGQLLKFLYADFNVV
jgi:hypothetical protein